MVKGIGTDILAYSHVVRSMKDEKFLCAVYTQAERRAAEQSEDRRRFYFTRFAGKEAVFKALGISAEAVRLTEIEILPDENGGPVVSLYGTVHYQAKRREIQEVLISLSWEDEYALAVAVAQ